MSSVGASIERSDSGGFTAIASNDDVDRDGERIAAGCFNPLPATVPIHIDHQMRASAVVARGRPRYVGGELRIEASFASTRDAQEVRQKVVEGVIDSMSIVFRGQKWRDIDGVRTCVKGELLAADLVSIPSNAGARILSMRSARLPSRRVSPEALLLAARAEVAQAKALLVLTDRRGPRRRRIGREVRRALTTNESTARFLRSL